MKYLFTFSFILLGSLLCSGQEPRDSKVGDRKKLEIGIDVTSALSKFVGNEALDIDAIPFLLRMHNKGDGAFRLGLGGIIDRGEFTDLITGAIRQTNVTSGSLKVGFEKNVYSKEKLSFYYGLDLLFFYERDEVTAANFFPIDLIKTVNRIGAGPFLGISYSVNSRIRLTTEASISIFVEESETIERINGQEQLVSSDSGLSGGVNPPFSLFINARF